MLAAAPSKAQEKITDARVGDTKAAIQKVIDWLDSSKYQAAVAKFRDLLLLTVDGELTDEEHKEILAAAELLEKIDEVGAEAIKKSVLGVPTIVPTNQGITTGVIPAPPKASIEPEIKSLKLKIDKDLIAWSPETGPNNTINLPWQINPGTTCTQHIFDKDGAMDLWETWYLQITQEFPTDKILPKKFITFWEARDGITAKVTYYLANKERIEIHFPMDGQWSVTHEAPARYKSALLVLIIDAWKNKGEKIPGFQMRKPQKN